MHYTVTAKPIEWNEGTASTNGWREWTEGRYGFFITFDPLEDADSRYSAAWGEGDQDHFQTLADAQQWCQSLIDAWIGAYAVVTPND